MVATPSLKPNAGGSTSDVLGSLFNFGTGIFNTIIDRENTELEFRIAQENRIATEQRAAEAQQRQDQFNGVALGGIDNNTILLMGGALVAALVISRLL